MDKMNKLAIGVVVALAAVGLLWAFNRLPQPPTTGDGSPAAATPEGAMMLSAPLKIGVVLPLTGDGAAYGVPIQRAAQIALEEINDAGGIGGKPVEVIWEDGKCEAKESTAAAQKLINVDNVKIIFGGVCSSETLAIAPLAEEKQVLVISPSATSPDITQAGAFTFRTAPSDAFAGQVAAAYAYAKLGRRSAAIISENKDYAQGLRRVFRDHFESLGGKVVVDETYNTGATDFSIAIIKIKAAAPDLIYLVPQTPAPGVQMITQLNGQEVAGQRLTAEVLIGRDIVASNGAAMEGVIGIEPYFNEQGPRAAAFLAAYEAKHQEKPPFPFFMANMHGQFSLVKDGVERVGLDTVKLRDWLTGLSGWQGTMGKLSLDANGEPLLDYAIKRVEDGKLEDVEIYSAAR